MSDLHADLLVIGWGKGGKTLARQAGLGGRRVVVVEQSDDMIGGSCINIACVPTKALIHDAEARRDGDDPQDAFDRAVARRDTLTGAMRSKNRALLEPIDGVTLVSGTARFVGPRAVEVAAGDDHMRITADAVCINTGSRAALPDVPGAQLGGRVHDSESLQHVTPFPRRLAVIGSGVVGLEFASIFAQFGSEVTVLLRGDRVMKHEDEAVEREAVAALEEAGVQFVRGATPTRIDRDDEAVRISASIDDEPHTFDADVLLLATGRRPWTTGLNLAAGGIDVDEHGWILVDDHLATSAAGVYAIGDVHGGAKFTYTSLDDSLIVADALFGDHRRVVSDREAVPSTIFLTPPLARVGITEHEARERGLEVRVATKRVADVSAMPRPKIEADPRGIISVVVDAADDTVLGAALMHVHADEVINLIALAMRHGVTAAELRDTVYTHPSATEALNEVLGELR